MKNKPLSYVSAGIVAVLLIGGMLMNIPGCSSAAGTQETTAARIFATEPVTIAGTNAPTEATTEAPITNNSVEQKKVTPAENSLVSIVRSDKEQATDLTYDDILALVRSAVDYVGGMASVVKDGDTVVLKPNLVTPIDYTLKGWNGKPLKTEVNGNCTDWRIARAVAVLVREVNPTGKIYIIEGSAFDTKDVYKKLKYTKENIPEVDDILALEDIGGNWRDDKSPMLAKVSLPDGMLNKEYYWARQLFTADVIIDMPCLKNHWNAGVTGAVKNMSIGATPASMYGADRGNNGRSPIPHDNLEFHQHLADFYACRPVDLVVMDSLQGLDNGPTPCFDLSGITDITTCQHNMRAILASRDGVAIDTVECNIMNYDIDTVDYLNFLNQRKIGNGDIQNITLTGNTALKDIRQEFPGPLPAYKVKRIPADQRTAPTVSIASAESDGGKTTVTIAPSADVLRTEIYINGVLKEIVKNNSKTTFEISEKGTLEVKVYNRRMYEASATKDIA